MQVNIVKIYACIKAMPNSKAYNITVKDRGIIPENLIKEILGD